MVDTVLQHSRFWDALCVREPFFTATSPIFTTWAKEAIPLLQLYNASSQFDSRFMDYLYRHGLICKVHQEIFNKIEELSEFSLREKDDIRVLLKTNESRVSFRI